MKTSSENIIQNLHCFIAKHSIDIIHYNLKSCFWWRGRKAILTKKYTNVTGEIINKETIVCILYPMQYKRFGAFVFQGLFFVRDLGTGVSIGGVDCHDLLMTGQRIKVQKQWLSFY